MSVKGLALGSVAPQSLFMPAKGPRPAHVMVAGVASAMAAEVYEVMAKDNAFYARHPDMQAFVDANWQGFLADARNSLTDSLALPSLTDAQKMEVFEALADDYAFLQASDRRSVGDIATGALH